MQIDEGFEKVIKFPNRLITATKEVGNLFDETAFTRTEVYGTGALRFIREGAELGVENIATGKKFFGTQHSVQEVLQSVLDLKISEFTEIVEPDRASLIAGDAVSQAEFGRLADLVKSINTEILSKDNDFAKQARAAAGLSDDFMGQKIKIERFGFLHGKELEAGELQSAVDDIAKGMLDQNQFMQSSIGLREQAARLAGLDDAADAKVLPGILNIQKEAAILLRAKIGDKYLTESQFQAILARMGSQVLDTGTLKRTLSRGPDDDLLASIGSGFAKGSKRMKAHTSARNLVATQEETGELLQYITEYVRNGGRGPALNLSSLDDAFLIYDTSLESVLKTFGLQSQYANEMIVDSGGVRKGVVDPKRLAMARRREAIGIVTEGYTEKVGRNFFTRELSAFGLSEEQTQRAMSFMQEALAGSGERGGLLKAFDSAGGGQGVGKININSIQEFLKDSTELRARFRYRRRGNGKN